MSTSAPISNATRPTRLWIAAGLLALAGLVRLLDAAVGLRASTDIASCTLSIFGLHVSAIDACYVPVGNSLLAALALLVLAGALAARPHRVAPLAAAVAGVLALAEVTTLMQGFDPYTTTTASVSILAAVPFLVVVPSGPAKTVPGRRLWFVALLACTLIAVADIAFSGMFEVSEPEPQVAFVVVGIAVLGAGLLSGWLERGAAIKARTTVTG